MSRLHRATLILASVCWIQHVMAAERPRVLPGRPQITDIKVIPGASGLNVEVITSHPAVVRSSQLSSPYRLIFDFPGFDILTRRISVQGSPATAVRTGMYKAATARIVIDLRQKAECFVRQDGEKTVIRISFAALGTSLSTLPSATRTKRTSLTQRPEPKLNKGVGVSPVWRVHITESRAQPARSRLQVDVDENGLLKVEASDCTFADVLDRIAVRVGAEVEPADEQARSVLASTGNQKITMNIGPASAREVVSNFFQGSPLDYIIIESATGALDKIVLIANRNASQVSETVASEISGAGDDAPPTVKIISPVAGSAVAGEVTIAATAEDGGGIAGVQFNVDGNNVGSEVTAEPYELNWNTEGVTPGTHVIAATARDHHGNTAISPSVIVTVGRTD